MELQKPYFMENPDWFFFDETEFRYKLKPGAPKKAQESYNKFYEKLEGVNE